MAKYDIEKQENKILNAKVDANGKILVKILYEGDGSMAYVFDSNGKKIRLKSEFAYKLIEDGRAIKISPNQTNSEKSARWLEDAKIDANGKYFVVPEHYDYAAHPNWNPTFYIVKNDFKLVRIGLKFAIELAEKNLAVELSKSQVDAIKNFPALRKAKFNADGKFIFSTDGTQIYVVQENSHKAQIDNSVARALIDEDRAVLMTDDLEKIRELELLVEKYSETINELGKYESELGVLLDTVAVLAEEANELASNFVDDKNFAAAVENLDGQSTRALENITKLIQQNKNLHHSIERVSAATSTRKNFDGGNYD